MSTLVGTVITLAQTKAIDEDEVDWTESELLTLYGLVLKLIVSLVPRAYTKTVSKLLSAGVKQGVSSNGIAFVGVTHNMGTDPGTTPGAAITQVPLEVMNRHVPNWASETAAAVIEHVMSIPDEPDKFFCYPPSDGTGYIEILESQTPPGTTYDSEDLWKVEAIPVSDAYAAAIPDGILYMAYDNDTDIPGNATKSEIYYRRFMTTLGLKATGISGGSSQWQRQ